MLSLGKDSRNIWVARVRRPSTPPQRQSWISRIRPWDAPEHAARNVPRLCRGASGGIIFGSYGSEYPFLGLAAGNVRQGEGLRKQYLPGVSYHGRRRPSGSKVSPR